MNIFLYFLYLNKKKYQIKYALLKYIAIVINKYLRSKLPYTPVHIGSAKSRKNPKITIHFLNELSANCFCSIPVSVIEKEIYAHSYIHTHIYKCTHNAMAHCI